ncbi:MAG: 50S ribosomal protein L15 [Candidatus Roizmanbacteria bacterium]|nr:50S ribosomal protein L15 [Candidatus Roizmanbacteria bacterium]
MISFLANLPTLVARAKKRLGRGIGSGKGVKSGRGTTRHQKARSTIPLHFEGGQGRLVKRFPLLRGKGRNYSRKTYKYVIYSEQLNVFDDGSVVDIAALFKANLIEADAKSPIVKLIKKGEVTKKLTVALPVTQSVKAMIEKAGGTVRV